MSKTNVSTIGNPEFIDLKPLETNPLMSSCQIKILYLKENRNMTYISKEAAIKMSKTLRGAPIVGYYKKDKEDYTDHGDQLIIDTDGIKFNSLTKPYGFVAPDAKVWFQKFEEEDDFGNKIVREYLMTTGYLWTDQYKESAVVIEEGRPQSMELDEKSLEGKWSTNSKSGLEFFIINNAIISKLCILGKDVEPCFENAEITSLDVSNNFNLTNNNFEQNFYNNMMQNFALKGGQMDNTQNSQNSTKDEKGINSIFTKEEEETEKKKEKSEQDNNNNNNNSKDDKKDKDEEEKDKKYALLEEKFSLLEKDFSNMKEEYLNLLSFKNQAENKEKDKLIESFYMLSEQDKEDVIKNKAKYSLEEIESKLSVICVRKKVNFDAGNENKTKEGIYTYSLPNVDDSLPAWIKSVINTQNNNE